MAAAWGLAARRAMACCIGQSERRA